MRIYSRVDKCRSHLTFDIALTYEVYTSILFVLKINFRLFQDKIKSSFTVVNIRHYTHVHINGELILVPLYHRII